MRNEFITKWEIEQIFRAMFITANLKDCNSKKLLEDMKQMINWIEEQIKEKETNQD